MLLVLLGLHLLVMYSSLAHSQPMLLILLVKLGPCLLLSSTSQGSPLLLTLQRTTSRGPRLLLTPLTSLYLSCLLLALMLQRISRVRLLLPASMRRCRRTSPYVQRREL